MAPSGVKNATRGFGCSLACLAAWAGAVVLLQAMRCGHGGHGTRAVLEAVSLIGWVGAFVFGLVAFGVMVVYSLTRVRK